jgi:hypothetical protein
MLNQWVNRLDGLKIWLSSAGVADLDLEPLDDLAWDIRLDEMFLRKERKLVSSRTDQEAQPPRVTTGAGQNSRDGGTHR